MTTATVIITSEPPGTPLSMEPNSKEDLQIVRALVRIAGEGNDDGNHIIIANGFLSGDKGFLLEDKYAAVLGKLKDSNPGSVIALITSDAVGEVNVISTPRSNEHDFSIAAAVAVFKASWGWDECDSILVRINGALLRIRARYDGSSWIVSEQV